MTTTPDTITEGRAAVRSQLDWLTAIPLDLLDGLELAQLVADLEGTIWHLRGLQ